MGMWNTLRLGLGLRMLLCAGLVHGSPAADPVDAGMPGVAIVETVDPAWADFRPRFTPGVCSFHDKGNYRADVVQCGSVQVPEDRTNASSRLIRIAVMRIPASSSTPTTDAWVYLDGGPGFSSISVERARAFDTGSAGWLHETRDVVFFDQRGVGESEAAFCRGVPAPYQYGVPLAQGQQRYQDRMRQCLADARDSGVAVDAYSTWQNALDTRDIRLALGYQQWNLYGESYGTALAQAILQVDAAGVRSAILDSVVPAVSGARGGWGAVAFGMRSSLLAIDADCAADPACAAKFQSMSAGFIRAIEGFGSDPLLIAGLDSSSFEGGRLVIDDSIAASIVFRVLYRGRLYGDLPILLRALQTRDVQALGAYAMLAGNPIDDSIGVGMALVTQCRGSNTSTALQAREMARLEPQLSQWLGLFDFSNECALLYPVRPDPARVPLESDLPILLLAGIADPITPPDYAHAVLPGLSNATLVEFPHTGHSAMSMHFGGCGGNLMRAFLADPHAPLDISCAARVAAPDFALEWRETDAAYRQVQAFRAGQGRAIPATVLLGLVVLLIGYPVAALVRRIRFPQAGATSLRRVRLLAWSAAALAMAAAIFAGFVVRGWIISHPLGLPMGLPNSIAWAGVMALAAFLLALLAAGKTLRMRSGASASKGTQAASVLGVLIVGAALYLLWQFGAALI